MPKFVWRCCAYNPNSAKLSESTRAENALAGGHFALTALLFQAFETAALLQVRLGLAKSCEKVVHGLCGAAHRLPFRCVL